MLIEKKIFGKLNDGTQIDIYTIRHVDGSEIQIMNYGAAIVSLKVPDKEGRVEEVVLGFDNLKDYENIRNFYGAIVGRSGNRIAKGKFSLNGIEYKLAINDGENHLHGGIKGFDRVVWDAKEINDELNPGVKLSYVSSDGEEGYPGKLLVDVTYTFSSDYVLGIDYNITCDKTTIKNITNHSYFNLSGNVKESILDHSIIFNSEKFLPSIKGLIPTGEFRNVKGTPMDFTLPHRIGERINEEDEQLKIGAGYDHAWVLKKATDSLDFAGSLYDPKSCRLMEIFTTEPGIGFYSGNFLDGSHSGHNGVIYKFRDGLCLQTQHFPDTPNHNNFPSTKLEPGETYQSKTIYKFSISQKHK
jgi:aldose 1-epimerase